jgi:hypothetical protein
MHLGHIKDNAARWTHLEDMRDGLFAIYLFLHNIILVDAAAAQNILSIAVPA